MPSPQSFICQPCLCWIVFPCTRKARIHCRVLKALNSRWYHWTDVQTRTLQRCPLSLSVPWKSKNLPRNLYRRWGPIHSGKITENLVIFSDYNGWYIHKFSQFKMEIYARYKKNKIKKKVWTILMEYSKFTHAHSELF